MKSWRTLGKFLDKYPPFTGFTIVELLIVVVIIAILAAVTIVAYNGIQDRAEASKTAAAVQAYKKALTMYKVDNDGVYPIATTFCLGDQYPAFPGNTTPACRVSGAQISAAANASSRDLLRPYLGGQLPMPSTKHISYDASNLAVGAHFYGSSYGYTLDGKPAVAIEYYVSSDTCPVGPVYSLSGNPHFSSPPVSRTGVLAGGSRCFMLFE